MSMYIFFSLCIAQKITITIVLHYIFVSSRSGRMENDNDAIIMMMMTTIPDRVATEKKSDTRYIDFDRSTTACVYARARVCVCFIVRLLDCAVYEFLYTAPFTHLRNSAINITRRNQLREHYYARLLSLVVQIHLCELYKRPSDCRHDEI